MDISYQKSEIFFCEFSNLVTYMKIPLKKFIKVMNQMKYIIKNKFKTK